MAATCRPLNPPQLFPYIPGMSITCVSRGRVGGRGQGYDPLPVVRIFGCVCATGRRGGLVVRALDIRSGGRWFEPGLCRHVVSLDKKLYSTLCSLSSPRCINGYRQS